MLSIYKYSRFLSAILISQLLASKVSAVHLDNRFFDLFSLSPIYADVKYGNISQLRDAFLAYHTDENTARLLYGLAMAFVRTDIMSDMDYRAELYKISVLDDLHCQDRRRFGQNKLPDVPCHFTKFTICVAAVLDNPENCLQPSDPAGKCPQWGLCQKAYQNLLAVESQAWMQLYAQETKDALLPFQNLTVAEIFQHSQKSCLVDSQFTSAIFNLAICSEISRQASYSTEKVFHPLVDFYCPDPCLLSPCAKPHLKHLLTSARCSRSSIKWETQHTIPHRWDNLKEQRNFNVRSQHSCDCRRGSWDSSKETCVISEAQGGNYQTCSPNLINKHFPCNAEGTFSCFDNKGLEDVPFVCRCKLGYSGILCHEKLSACLQTVTTIELNGKQQSMTGNRMCNVNNDGEPLEVGKSPSTRNACKVKEHLNSRSGFTCECAPPYFTIIGLEDENCLGVVHYCDTKLCINGECISSPDLMTNGACKCYSGWGGDYCDTPLTDWSLWSGCLPICGILRIRTRFRQGDWVSNQRFFNETEVCAARNCSDTLDENEYKNYQTLLFVSCVESTALIACLLFAVLTFAMLRFWQPRFIYRDAWIHQ